MGSGASLINLASTQDAILTAAPYIQKRYSTDLDNIYTPVTFWMYCIRGTHSLFFDFLGSGHNEEDN